MMLGGMDDLGRRAAHSDDDKDYDQGQGRQHGALEPQLAILEIEPHLDQIAHELGLSAELFADHGPRGGLEGAIDADEGEERGEDEIGNERISVKPDMGRLALMSGVRTKFRVTRNKDGRTFTTPAKPTRETREAAVK